MCLFSIFIVFYIPNKFGKIFTYNKFFFHHVLSVSNYNFLIYYRLIRLL